MTSIGDGQFQKGEPVWVTEPDGSQRAADFVGEGEMSAWFRGFTHGHRRLSRHAQRWAVEVDRVIPRDA